MSVNDHLHVVNSVDDGVALQLSNCSISYRGKIAIQDATLSMPRNQITAIVGPSGCGKTSLLRALNRTGDLIAGCNVSGQVLVNGEDIYGDGIDVTDLRRRVGMIFQAPNPFPTSIRRNLQFALKTSGIRKRRLQSEQIESLLKRVGLWNELADRLDTAALALSGGQQQRLCIARALAVKPDILLMDEPCSSLDPMATEVIEQLIVELKQHYTVVVVTHNLAQARRIADQLVVCWSATGCGCVVESGPAGDIFNAPQSSVAEAFLNGTHG